MGKTKQVKKNIEKNHEQASSISKNELKSFIIVIAIVIIIFLAFYGITLLIHQDEEQLDNEVVQETIQYSEILVGQILNRNQKEYYVLVKEQENVYNELYSQYLDLYSSNDGIYYTVDLNHAFNQNYISDSTLVKGKEVSQFQFSDTTLIKVKNKKIDKVYSTHEEIVAALEKLV